VHAVGCNETSKGPSGEQKSDIQASDVKSSPVGLPAEVSCIDVFVIDRAAN
jgi:hypothetical protein